MRFNCRAYVAPALLFLLGTITVAFGALQMSLLQQGDVGAQSEMASAHYFSMPIPIIVHIIAGSLFNLLVPLQFVAPLRARFPRVHRYLGGCLALCALAFGLSALWMNGVYPQYGGAAKFWGIIAHCCVLLGSLALALMAIRKKQVARHRAWMMRMTAAALSPATQRLFFIPAVVVFGENIVTDVVIGGVIWFGLIVNLVFVEWWLFRSAATEQKLYRGTIASELS
ncbi:Predicted membrane protein [Alteromonadaceae bacterium Bs31]|nr:Predicted membrane protein [Alteromonadaceae bacterium Bs31]